MKYGLGITPDYRNDKVPPENYQFDSTPADFGPDLGGVSYFLTRWNPNPADPNSCGPERASPLPGQVLLRERTDCTPTSEGPGLPGTSCRVEIPLSDGGVTPVADASEVYIANLANGFLFGSEWRLSTQTGNTLGGTSDDSNPICLETNIRRKPTTGTRYVLPASRGGNGSMTYVRWDSALGIADRPNNATNFRLHTDDSEVCCSSSNPTVCNILNPGTPSYPPTFKHTCASPSRFVNDDNTVPDWIFEAGRGSRFYSDSDFVLPGQLMGVCKVNRFQPCGTSAANASCTGPGIPFSICCTGAGTGTCGTECAGLDSDPDTPGLQPDTCDLREPGPRTQARCARLNNGDPRPDCCGTALEVFRGSPMTGCSLLPRYAVDGDPGFDCGVLNFGVDHRDDNDCDGIADYLDGCPFLSEWDQDRDSDGDCADGVGGDCRLDECECGDQSGDGRVNVSDLVAINLSIFGSVPRSRLCDANSDHDCNVSDIVSVNREMFVPNSSTCLQITSGLCGNGVVDPGEGCDDAGICRGGSIPGAWCGDFFYQGWYYHSCGTGGACVRVGGDGCDPACRVELGWTCTGSPSVCTQN